MAITGCQDRLLYFPYVAPARQSKFMAHPPGCAMTNGNQQGPPARNQSTVVAHMMTPGVVQIPGDVTVTEAASLLEREQMPCLLVKDSESRFGLMTPADIVKKVVAQGLEPDDVEVRAIMTRPVHFIEYDRAVEEASSLMLSSGMPILIVTKQNQPVGVLTARDLVLSPKRCQTSLPATVSVPGLDGRGAPHQGRIIQLSHVGALLESPVVLQSGTKVVLTFALPDNRAAFTLHGTVLSDDEEPAALAISSSPAFDIQFTGLSPSDQSRLKAWVLQNTPKCADLS